MERDAESKIISSIEELQTRISYLEKKIDMLVAQSSERPARGRNYAPSSQTYGKSNRYAGARENRYGPKNPRSDRPFGNKRNDDDRGFSKEKKPFSFSSKKRSDKPRKKGPGAFKKNKKT